MQYLGIEFDIKNKPVLDPDFIPFGVWMKEYLKEAAHPIKIAVEREDGLISMRESFIRTGDFAEADLRYVERLVKFELWSIGGFRVYICGADDIAEKLAEAYSPTGARQFDYGFVGDVYEKPLEVLAVSEADFPASMSLPSRSAATWRAAASDSMRVARIARCQPSSTERPSTRRRWSGIRR